MQEQSPMKSKNGPKKAAAQRGNSLAQHSMRVGGQHQQDF